MPPRTSRGTYRGRVVFFLSLLKGTSLFCQSVSEDKMAEGCIVLLLNQKLKTLGYLVALRFTRYCRSLYQGTEKTLSFNIRREIIAILKYAFFLSLLKGTSLFCLRVSVDKMAEGFMYVGLLGKNKNPRLSGCAALH